MAIDFRPHFIKKPKRRSAAPLLLCMATLSCSGQTAPEETRYYASAVDKGQVGKFYARMANDQHQLVVTSTPVESAHDSAFVSVGGDESLYVVELRNQNEPTLKGEQARVENFALVTGPTDQDPHAILGRHDLFAQRVGPTETTTATDTGSGQGLDDGELSRTILQNGLKQAREALETDATRAIVVDKSYVEAKIKELTGVTSVVVNGRTLALRERRSQAGRDDARVWLKREYEALGFTVTEQKYGSSLSGGTNFIASRTGADPNHFIVIGSHYDTVATAGADDDGAGTISALAVAKALQGKELKVGVKIVAFDQEELGLVGSAAYAKKLKDDNQLGQLVGVMTLEMTGYDANNDGAFHAIDCNENTSADITRLVVAAASGDAALRLRKNNACTNRSDHASFWRYNKPAIVVSQDFFGGDDNPCYHKACDTVDRMNLDYMARLSTAIARSVNAWVVSE